MVVGGSPILTFDFLRRKIHLMIYEVGLFLIVWNYFPIWPNSSLSNRPKKPIKQNKTKQKTHTHEKGRFGDVTVTQPWPKSTQIKFSRGLANFFRRILHRIL